MIICLSEWKSGSRIEKWFHYCYLSRRITTIAIVLHDACKYSVEMTIVCSIPGSCNCSDGGTATANKTLMSLFFVPRLHRFRHVVTHVQPQQKSWIVKVHARPSIRRQPQKSSFFCPSPLPFGGSTVLSLSRRPAGNRTTPAVCQRRQERRDTNWATRTTQPQKLVMDR